MTRITYERCLQILDDSDHGMSAPDAAIVALCATLQLLADSNTVEEQSATAAVPATQRWIPDPETPNESELYPRSQAKRVRRFAIKSMARSVPPHGDLEEMMTLRSAPQSE